MAWFVVNRLIDSIEAVSIEFALCLDLKVALILSVILLLFFALNLDHWHGPSLWLSLDVFQWHFEGLISLGHDLVEVKLVRADQLLLAEIILLGCVIHVVYLNQITVFCFEKELGFDGLDELGF